MKNAPQVRRDALFFARAVLRVAPLAIPNSPGVGDNEYAKVQYKTMNQ